MRISNIFDPGSVKFPEDGLVFCLPHFLGVADGVSGVYDSGSGPTLFDGKTGGRMITEIIQETFSKAQPDDNLEEIIRTTNSAVREKQVEYGWYDQNPPRIDLIAGATISIVKISQESICVVTLGDAMAFIETKKSLITTRNQTFLHDTEQLATIERLMRECKSNRTEMWKRFGPLLSEARIRDINNPGSEKGYGLLNGQGNFGLFLQKITMPKSEVRLVILCTDGLVWYPETGDHESLAKKLVSLYWQGGLEAILQDTRTKERKNRKTSHIDYAEATAIAIEF